MRTVVVLNEMVGLCSVWVAIAVIVVSMSSRNMASVHTSYPSGLDDIRALLYMHHPT